MKPMIQFMIYLGLTTLLTACGQSDFVPSPLPDKDKPVVDTRPQTQSLGGKSVEEVLKLKYNSAQIQCELYLKNGPAAETASTVGDKIAIVDLRNGLPENREIKLQVKAGERVADVTLTLKTLEMHTSITYTDLKAGTVQKMEYSPYVTADLNYKEKLPADDGFIFSSGRQGLTLTEKIEARPINSWSSSDTDTEPMVDVTLLSCTLVTEIKAEYKDQFSIEKL